MSLEHFQERIREAAGRRGALRLRGGGTKDFYGNAPRGELLDTRTYAGIVSYEPTELVITARCGTPLAEIDKVLEQHRQMLAFEPPHFGAGATFGGCIAAGLSGPRRAAAGALRDFVLGVKLVDGRARALSFGGQVMKNVAGYDLSRLVAGSLGTLALIAEASVKVLPAPACETTLQLAASQDEALDHMNRWAGQPLPVSATAWSDGLLRVRLSGAAAGVRSAAQKIGGTTLEDADAFWTGIREQRDAFFRDDEPLWRLALPSTCPPLALAGRQLIEWGGGLRWLKSSADPRDAARRAGGHATRFRGPPASGGAFTPLEPVLSRLHRELKAAFDPAGVLNPGRLFPEL
ncbi:MAG TPA: glycolate oxidase subunit GlcE [Burkholderiales bacterium]|nr:glycolate oxidase subunit GlcE [Burkholderiales bacterium]